MTRLLSWPLESSRDRGAAGVQVKRRTPMVSRVLQHDVAPRKERPRAEEVTADHKKLRLAHSNGTRKTQFCSYDRGFVLRRARQCKCKGAGKLWPARDE
jgi:hypothetical protein